MDIIEKAKNYAISCHRETNHKYDGKPYEFHLEMVANEASFFSYLLPENERANFIAAAYVHDTIEDCRQTYNNVLNATNKEVAELAYALTNEKGKTRNERASSKYYQDMKLVPNAVLLKICDRIANFKYSTSVKSKMADVYCKENDDFINKIKDSGFDIATAHLILLVKQYEKEKNERA